MSIRRRRVPWWGGTMKELLLPPTGLIWPALAGFALLPSASPRLGFTLLLTSFGGLVFLSLPWVHRRLWRLLDRYPPLDPGDGEPREESAIVVLDAGRHHRAREYGGDSIKPRTLERLRFAAWLYRRWRLPVLVSGNGAGELMGEVLRSSFGVPEVWLEADSRNTRESAVKCSRLLGRKGIGHAYLVTHFWHMPRAAGAFEDADLEITPAPMGLCDAEGTEAGWLSLVPRISALEGTYCAVHELIGLTWYRLWYRQRPAKGLAGRGRCRSLPNGRVPEVSPQKTDLPDVVGLVKGQEGQDPAEGVLGRGERVPGHGGQEAVFGQAPQRLAEFGSQLVPGGEKLADGRVAFPVRRALPTPELLLPPVRLGRCSGHVEDPVTAGDQMAGDK